MAQTKFLITGATGYTGGYTVRQLLEKNQAVRVLETLGLPAPRRPSTKEA